MSAPDPFERLLRWYPSRWQQENGAVLVGMLRDQADREGRSAPTSAERVSAMVNGTAARLDARTAAWLAVAALLINAASALVMLFGTGMPPMSAVAAGIVTTAVTPASVLIGAVALLRARAWVTGGRAMLVLGVLLPAVAFGALARTSWSQGFQLADEGLPTTGFAAGWLPFLVIGWGLGAVGIGLIVEGILQRSVGLAARIALGTLVGAVSSVVLGTGLAVSGSLLSSAVAIVVVILALRWIEAPPDVRARMIGTRPDDAARLDAPGAGIRSAAPVRPLCWLSAAGGLAGVLIAFTGPLWLPGATDGTIAMGQGITILLASALPLLAAIGWTVRSRRSRAQHWGPIIVVGLAVTMVAMAYLAAPEWDGMVPWMVASAVLGGTAIAWWASARLPGPMVLRFAASGAIGIAIAAVVGVAVLPLLSFAVPVVAVVLALRPMRRRQGAAVRVVQQSV